MSLTINSSQWEAILLQDVSNCTEFKCANFMDEIQICYLGALSDADAKPKYM